MGSIFSNSLISGTSGGDNTSIKAEGVIKDINKLLIKLVYKFALSSSTILARASLGLTDRFLPFKSNLYAFIKPSVNSFFSDRIRNIAFIFSETLYRALRIALKSLDFFA